MHNYYKSIPLGPESEIQEGRVLVRAVMPSESGLTVLAADLDDPMRANAHIVVACGPGLEVGFGPKSTTLRPGDVVGVAGAAFDRVMGDGKHCFVHEKFVLIRYEHLEEY